MTKRFVVLQLMTILVCSQSVVTHAAIADTGPGCGLGKVAWQDYKHPKNILPQILMSITNNFPLPWQAFGITTGTLGCTNDGVVMGEEKANLFAAINLDNLAQEMAQGHGEHLASLATLMGIPTEHQAEFFTLTQEKYMSLMQSGETTAVAMLKALHEVVTDHPVLAKVSMNR